MLRQVNAITKKLPEFITIRKSTMEGKLFIPNTYLGKALSIISKYATEEGKSYNSEGCTMNISVVPGCYDQLMIELNTATKGEAIFAVDSVDSNAKNSGIPASDKKELSKKELKKQKKKGNRKQLPQN